jgi:sporulation protein YqfC
LIQKKNSVWRRIRKSLWIPDPYSAEHSHILITGQERISIDQTANIITYEENVVVLRLKNCRLTLRGDKLMISSYTDKNIVVSGSFCSISFE